MDSWLLFLLLVSSLTCLNANNVTTVSPTTGANVTTSATEPASSVAPTNGAIAGPDSLNKSSVLPLTTRAAVIIAPMSNVPGGESTPTPTAGDADFNNHTEFTNVTSPSPTVINGTSPPVVPATDGRTTDGDGVLASTSETSATESFTSAGETEGHGDPGSEERRDETPIIAVMVALSSLLVIVFIIIVLYMLRFKKYKQAGSHSNSFRLSNGRADDTEPQSMPLLARSPSTNRKYPPLPVDKLEEEINRRMADDNKMFREEFNALPACPIQATCEAASKEENKEKNRYVNILPYDHSRLHLAPIEGVPDSDYINASFINGYQEKNKFVAAQGPKEETVNDYWRMIWEQNTATIVMVTNLKERKECKCAQYWPDQGCWTYGNIRVSVEDMTVLVDYTVRKFCIQQVGDVTNKKPQRLVTQFHFTSWPDFGVPFTPIGMLKFLKKVKTCNPQYAGAIVVHCSAGVGRTGTFVVIDAMLDMMNSEKKVDVYGFVSRIRAQRCQMVQTDVSKEMESAMLLIIAFWEA
ncbi:hypothetical protein FKM82_001739 [Ascaphus truei]